MCPAEPTRRIKLIARTGAVAYLQPGTGTGCQLIGLSSSPRRHRITDNGRTSLAGITRFFASRLFRPLAREAMEGGRATEIELWPERNDDEHHQAVKISP